MRRRLVLFLKLTVSAGLLAYVLWSITQREGLGQLTARIEGLDYRFILLATTLHFAAIGAGVMRYRLLLTRRDIRVPLGWLTQTYLVGRFIGAFTPSTVGLDLYRSVAVAKRTGRAAASGAAILAEKLFGLLGLAVVTLGLLCVGAGELLGPSALPLALAIAAGAAVGLFGLRHPRLLHRIIGFLPARLAKRIGPMIDAIASAKSSSKDTLVIFAFSLASHLATAAVFVATAWAIGLVVEPAKLLVVGNVIVIATLLPISIGGVGVREGVAVALLATVAVGPTDAGLVALLGYLTGQIPALFGGALQMRGAALAAASAPAPAEPTEGVPAF